jgi:WD40 repeat protein
MAFVPRIAEEGGGGRGRLAGHAAAVTAISIFGQTIATADEKGRVTLHRAGLVQPSMELVAGTAPLSAIAYDTPGERLAVAAEDGFIRIFEASSGRLDLEFRANQRKIRSLSFSRDGHFLLAAGEDHATRLWPVQTNLRTLIESAVSNLRAR